MSVSSTRYFTLSWNTTYWGVVKRYSRENYNHFSIELEHTVRAVFGSVYSKGCGPGKTLDAADAYPWKVWPRIKALHSHWWVYC